MCVSIAHTINGQIIKSPAALSVILKFNATFSKDAHCGKLLHLITEAIGHYFFLLYEKLTFK